MNKLFSMVALSFVLVACVAGNQFSESWSRSVFTPSEASFRKACVTSINTPLEQDIGEVWFSSPNGKVFFVSAPGTLGIDCQFDFAFGLQDRGNLNNYLNSSEFKELMADSQAFFVVYTQKNMADVAAHISLENANGEEFAQLISNNVEGVIPGFRYNFTRFSALDIENIAKTSSFSLVVNRGFGEEKFRVTPDNLDPFKLN
jgi:hypothetical protein